MLHHVCVRSFIVIAVSLAEKQQAFVYALIYNNIEIKDDIENLLQQKVEAITVFLPHQDSDLSLAPTRRTSEECKILYLTGHNITAQKVYINMASTSVCITTMVK